MDNDPDIANWILDFYLRLPLDDKTLDSVLRALPFPSNDPNLQKLILLKKLEAEASQQPISETALEIIEQLEELEFRRGNKEVSDAMRRAYCLAAVDCTLSRSKVGSGDGKSKYEFFEMVKRVWRERIGRVEKTAAEGGLGSEELWEWKDMIEAAVWDDRVCKSVLKKFEGVNVVEAVKIYVREEREKMGPPFLEVVAEKLKNDEVLQRIMGFNVVDVGAEEGVAKSCDDDAAAGGSKPSKEGVAKSCDAAAAAAAGGGSKPSKEKNKPRIKLVIGLRKPRGMPSSNSRGAKIVDSDETAIGPSCGNSSPLSEEVKKAREALKLSSMELRAAVKDPLPDALRIAEAICNGSKQDKQQDPVGGDDGRPETLFVDAAGVVQSNGGDTSSKPKPSLMERNSTARTYEWDDSIDGSQEDITCRSTIRVPSPKRINTSPLKIYEMNNVKKRRKGRRWSLLEEDTLRAGVEKYGKGNWKVILTANRDIFEGRTEVDLKDKWRNMTRY